jgi:hypothetical protein
MNRITPMSMPARWASLTLIALTLAACAGTRNPDPVSTQAERENRERVGSIFGPDGLTFGGSRRARPDEEGSGLGVNSFLWRAALDTVSFMPVVSADPFGGTIITDWFTPGDQPNERVKVNLYILDRQLRSDGVRAAVFRQAREASGGWRDVPVARETNTQMENAILARARELRIAQNASR